jgi:hypothetical protein
MKNLVKLTGYTHNLKPGVYYMHLECKRSFFINSPFWGCLFGLTVSVFFITPSAAKASPSFARIQGDQFVVDGEIYKLKGTNYYPKSHMWAEMWNQWDWYQIQQEVDMMHELGLNAVRILVPYSNGGWDGPYPPESRLQMLEDIVNLMGEHGIRSVVTLFDWETSFPAVNTSKESEHLTYLSIIVNRLKDNPHVLMWDVKNEPDHPANFGWCTTGSWDCSPYDRNRIVSWLHRMCDAVRSMDPNHPATAGMRWWENLPDVIDFVDVAIFHSYDWPINTEITDTKNLMGAYQKPIVVEEWGWPSHPTPCRRDSGLVYSYNEEYQLGVYQDHLTAMQNHDIAGGLQWMTFDDHTYVDDPDHTFEDYFGLWRYDYSLKPAGEYYRDNFPVKRFPGTPPGAPVNFTATHNGNKVALSWQNPASNYYWGTIIRVSTASYPSHSDDGELVCKITGEPGHTENFEHQPSQVGVTHYYSAFAYSLSEATSVAAHDQIIPLASGDYDADNDVDMIDFGHLQRCFTGPYIPPPPECADAELDGDNDIDQDDLAIFKNCLSGSGVPPTAGCNQK